MAQRHGVRPRYGGQVRSGVATGADPVRLPTPCTTTGPVCRLNSNGVGRDGSQVAPRLPSAVPDGPRAAIPSGTANGSRRLSWRRERAPGVLARIPTQALASPCRAWGADHSNLFSGASDGYFQEPAGASQFGVLRVPGRLSRSSLHHRSDARRRRRSFFVVGRRGACDRVPGSRDPVPIAGRSAGRPSHPDRHCHIDHDGCVDRPCDPADDPNPGVDAVFATHSDQLHQGSRDPMDAYNGVRHRFGKRLH